MKIWTKYETTTAKHEQITTWTSTKIRKTSVHQKQHHRYNSSNVKDKIMDVGHCKK